MVLSMGWPTVPISRLESVMRRSDDALAGTGASYGSVYKASNMARLEISLSDHTSDKLASGALVVVIIERRATIFSNV